MANTAAQQLQALEDEQIQIDMGFSPLDELDEAARQAPTTRKEKAEKEPGKAGFGTAQGALVAVGMGLVFGPLAGVMLGGARGFMKQKEDQQLLDQLADEENALTDSVDVRQELLNGFYKTATSREDVQQLDILQSKLDAGTKLGGKSFLGAQAQAAGLFQSFDQDLTQFGITQDSQKIAADLRNEQDARDLTATQLGNFNTMKDDYDNDSAAFVGIMDAVELGKEALKSRNPAILNIAITSAVRMLDDASIISLNEKEGQAGLGTFKDYLVNLAEKLGDGGQLTDPQRIQLDAAFELMGTVTRRQQSRIDKRYQDNAIADLSPKFATRFNRAANMPEFGGALVIEEAAGDDTAVNNDGSITLPATPNPTPGRPTANQPTISEMLERQTGETSHIKVVTTKRRTN